MDRQIDDGLNVRQIGGQLDDGQMNKMDVYADGWTIDDDDNDEDNRDEDDDDHDRHSIPNARVDVFRSRRKSTILLINTCYSETDIFYG